MTDGASPERMSNNLAWNKAGIKFLAAFLVALIQPRSVNLVRIAAVFGGRANYLLLVTKASMSSMIEF